LEGRRAKAASTQPGRTSKAEIPKSATRKPSRRPAGASAHGVHLNISSADASASHSCSIPFRLIKKTQFHLIKITSPPGGTWVIKIGKSSLQNEIHLHTFFVMKFDGKLSKSN
jgi:hypothetical protein